MFSSTERELRNTWGGILGSLLYKWTWGNQHPALGSFLLSWSIAGTCFALGLGATWMLYIQDPELMMKVTMIITVVILVGISTVMSTLGWGFMYHSLKKTYTDK